MLLTSQPYSKIVKYIHCRSRPSWLQARTWVWDTIGSLLFPAILWMCVLCYVYTLLAYASMRSACSPCCCCDCSQCERLLNDHFAYCFQTLRFSSFIASFIVNWYIRSMASNGTVFENSCQKVERTWIKKVLKAKSNQ